MQTGACTNDLPTLRIVNWNVEWATSTSVRGLAIADKIAALKPHVVCLTEAHVDFFSQGHVVTADADYGYGDKGTRRKVVLWSLAPWTSVEVIGEPTLPSGRFVAATTTTPLGPIRFIGVCIPWKDAHVRTGRKDRSAWEDHSHYLEGLQAIVNHTPMDRLILFGDFNQTVPRKHVPVAVFERLSSIVKHFCCPTAGSLSGAATPTIDHICHSSNLCANSISVLSNQHEEIGRLSDHFGLSMLLQLTERP